MKKLVLIASTLLTLSTAAQARYFRMGADCFVQSGRKGICVAYNDSNRPMYCRGRVYGETYYGYSFRANGSGTVYPGQEFYLYVYAQNPMNDPLVQTSGNIECRF